MIKLGDLIVYKIAMESGRGYLGYCKCLGFL
jgi:hypothetical protein